MVKKARAVPEGYREIEDGFQRFGGFDWQDCEA